MMVEQILLPLPLNKLVLFTYIPYNSRGKSKYIDSSFRAKLRCGNTFKFEVRGFSNGKTCLMSTQHFEVIILENLLELLKKLFRKNLYILKYLLLFTKHKKKKNLFFFCQHFKGQLYIWSLI